ncbi:glycerophosphodiester phosphodiesterase family protein [Cohnella luojiensis]|nr:glycerophosphodiester phosphodiesterase family protein [Cohnella luojiensis]
MPSRHARWCPGTNEGKKSAFTKIHDRNRKVMAWTIRKERDDERMKRLGVDGIITDYPDWGID